VIFLAASGITAFGSISPLLPAAAGSVPAALALAPAPGVPLHSDASAGRVVLTFDDGPDFYTAQVIAELDELHLHGVFFDIGSKAAAHPELVHAEIASGNVVGNHTWDHKSFTGKGVGVTNKPLTQAQVRAELSGADAAIVSAGAPKPVLWRPPYGAVNAADEQTAASLGLRIVLDSGTNIIDSNDWAGLTAAQIAARVDPRLRDGTIIAFHDGLRTAPQMIAALPLIVAYMNAHHLGATTTVRPDATGGVVPDDNTGTGGHA
jgi:peptidoglycan/xylan/chitin deacetylase (PgdA/CDA1 family)